MTPRNGTDDLWKPPVQVIFTDVLEGVRFEDVPESTTLCIVHNEVEVCAGLESAQEMWRPDGTSAKGAKKDLSFKLGIALL